MSIRDRIVRRVAVDSATGCWNWLGCVQANGYGRVNVNRRPQYAHRASYTEFKGPIPAGMYLDHLCRNTRCVNPDHLEAVTPRENHIRGAHPWAEVHRSGACKRGHPQPQTGRYEKNGTCLACIPILSRRQSEKRRTSAA